MQNYFARRAFRRKIETRTLGNYDPVDTVNVLPPLYQAEATSQPQHQERQETLRNWIIRSHPPRSVSFHEGPWIDPFSVAG
jgi:hypothetical protein